MAQPATSVNPDIAFLEGIDARVSRMEKGTYGNQPITYRMSADDEALTENEMERILSLMNGDDYVISPQNMNMGFRAGIVVATAEAQAPGLPLDSRWLLSFTDKQFPASYTWEQVADVYMGPRNLELLAQIGAEAPDPRKSRYDY
jgi:hypothetical protein